MKNYINYYNNKDTFDKVAKILIEKINSKKDQLNKKLIADLRWHSDSDLVASRDRINRLEDIRHMLKDSQYLLRLDILELSKDLGMANFSGHGALVNFIFNELDKEDEKVRLVLGLDLDKELVDFLIKLDLKEEESLQRNNLIEAIKTKQITT